ncbi:hypothetical protein QBC47DRAFT_374058 [Echria macrotheca]|uniref:C3H1-type domain-containing protein n=1 Tax=Echria macrotheca TaxID=438768 RepID=A0AAJ0F7R4_9PEZI|nr:hypothetical protein QBC47DRAFT_374058 [Echria macrotheca]
MSTDDQEILARISELAGRINRHKNQQAGIVSRTSSGTPRGRSWVDGFQDTGSQLRRKRGGYPYYRGSSSGPAPHRHRSLVLNGKQPANNELDSDTPSDASTSSWVTKNDRHLQLINSSIYEKDAKARTAAIEQTRRQKRRLRDERERTKLINHLTSNSSSAMGPPGQPSKYEISIDGIRFIVVKNGSKLVKVQDIANMSLPTPKMAMVGGVKFYRSKNGNLYRHGIIKAQRQTGTFKKVNVPCKTFSMTGSCLKGPQCRYIHDPEKVAICRDFLQHGECPNGDVCDLSHDPTPERTPACLHYAKDSCNKADCRYAHVKVSPGAPVCRPFGLYGYCDNGANCTDRHVFECPDFSNTGVCNTKGCKLPHRERASTLRKAKEADVEMEDVSSDDDGESVNSDDVDSDAVDEFINTEMDYIPL